MSLRISPQCLAVVTLAVSVVASCAAPFSELDPKVRRNTCAFLGQRTRQMDVTVSLHTARRAIASNAKVGQQNSPTFQVHARIVFNSDGHLSSFPDLELELPSTVPDGARQVLVACFETALGSIRIPPPGRRVSVPLTLIVDPPDGEFHAAEEDSEDGCTLVLREPEL